MNGLDKLIKRSLRVAYSTILSWALEKTNNRGMPSFDVLYHAAWDAKSNCHVRARFQLTIIVIIFT